jgi:8-oxo-dGTP pyrophosphatase MutT (NUDIX family)
MQAWQECGTLSSEQIRERLATIPTYDRALPGIDGYRKAAVLIPMVCEKGEMHLVYTRRTDLVHDHKGQVAFPGGAVDDHDRDFEDTALRETYEEIGIPPSEICVLGKLPVFPTITGYVITPIVGLVPWPYDLHVSAEEVSRVFTVPLQWLADPNNREEKDMILFDGRPERVVFFDTYDGEKVWGATARITLQFLKALKVA